MGCEVPTNLYCRHSIIRNNSATFYLTCYHLWRVDSCNLMNYVEAMMLLLLVTLQMAFPTSMVLGIPKVCIEDSIAQLSNVTIS